MPALPCDVIPPWLREVPDSMLLDFSANESIFPFAIRQAALCILKARYTRYSFMYGIYPPAPTVLAYLANRRPEQLSFSLLQDIVNGDEATVTEAIQVPDGTFPIPD